MALHLAGLSSTALTVGDAAVRRLIFNGNRTDIARELFKPSTSSWSNGWTWEAPSFRFHYEGTRANVYANVSTEAGQKYRIRFDYDVTSNVFLRFGLSAQRELQGVGHYDQVMEAERSSTMLFHANSADADGAVISNVSLVWLP